MDEVTDVFLRAALNRTPTGSEVRELRDTYIGEWNTGVSYPAGMADLIRRLSADYVLVIVTNTHQPDLVPMHLTAMGVANFITDVVTSVEGGSRKPHPAIYQTALARASITAPEAVFVGDTCDADYQGPGRLGIPAFLIDPHHRAGVPPARRLESLFDLPARLEGGSSQSTATDV